MRSNRNDLVGPAQSALRTNRGSPHTCRARFLSIVLIGVLAPLTSQAEAQQIGISTPFTSASDGYYERMGVNFGFSFPGGRGPGSRIVGLTPGGLLTQNGNINFNQGGMSSAIPTFGGYDPNASARTGFGLLAGGGGGFSLGLELGQGSTRSMTNTTPFTMVQNGYGGSISNGAFRPFVTGVIPVTSGRNSGPYPLDNAVTRAIRSGSNLTSPRFSESDNATRSASDFAQVGSSATVGDISVAAIKAQKKRAIQARKSEFQSLLKDVTEFEAAGDYRNARIQLRRAIRMCESPSKKRELKSHLSSIRRR